MEEGEKIHRFGKTPRKKLEPSKFYSRTFYYPAKLEICWKEFDSLSKKEIPFFLYPERCKSLLLRRMMLKFVYEKTTKQEVKQLISQFLTEENKFIESKRTKTGRPKD
jgi:hypothetical protein